MTALTFHFYYHVQCSTVLLFCHVSNLRTFQQYFKEMLREKSNMTFLLPPIRIICSLCTFPLLSTYNKTVFPKNWETLKRVKSNIWTEKHSGGMVCGAEECRCVWERAERNGLNTHSLSDYHYRAGLSEHVFCLSAKNLVHLAAYSGREIPN